MLRLCALLLFLALPAAADPSGPIRVIDGDTFDIGGTKVRLYGVDAPEVDQLCTLDGQPWRCGVWSSQEVRARYQGKTANCDERDRDRYGRVVATCTVGGQDMGRALVRDGLVLAFRRYAMDYDLDEKAAAIAGRGLHAGELEAPAAYRAASRDRIETGPNGCALKGNISGDGKRIFHSPGQENYARTRINTAKGERWFCSAADAEAAGWRAARR